MTYLFSNTSSIFQSNGSAITTVNPLPVTLGSANINIIGNITIPTTVNVASSPDNPVHTHITEVGTSGNLLANNISYMPIGGNVGVTQITTPWVVTGNINSIGSANIAFPVGATNLFGELYSTTLTPTVQLDALHGYDPSEVQIYTGSDGNVFYTNNIWEVTTTSNIGSYAVVRSRDFNSFRSGESLIGRWLVKFGAPVAGCQQRVGLQNQESGLYVGYNGTTFGLLNINGGTAPIYKITVTSYTGAQTVTVTLNSVTHTVTIPAGETINNVAQRIALKMVADMGTTGAWVVSQRDNTVLLLSTATAPLGGTFSVSGSGTMVIGITTVVTGVAPTNTWITDATSNLPSQYVQPSWLVPGNYNSFAIKYLWPRAVFYGFNPNTVQYEYIGRIVGTDTLPVKNPTFKSAALVSNTGGTPVTMSVPAMYMGVEGIEARVSNPASFAVTHSTLASGNYWHVLSIQNPYVANGKLNTLQCNPLDLTVSLQCNDPSQVYIYVDTPLATGLHDFVSQDGRPIDICSVDGTFNGATSYPVVSFIVGTTGTTTQFNLTDYRLNIPPGGVMSIAVYSTASINRASAAITWHNV